MDNTLLIALNTQQTLRQRMDMTANNIANMNTAGFKAERMMIEEVTERPARAMDRPNDIRFANPFALQRDMTSGSLKASGNSLDLAINNPNVFFTLQGGGETLYSRDGQFALDDLSRLVSHDGQMVLDAAGNEIVFDPEGGEATISETGVIRQRNIEIAQLGLAQFDIPEALAKRGGNMWSVGDQAPRQAEAPAVKQGFVEQSNVNSVFELTEMIEVSRAYASASSIIKDANELRQSAISKLGAVT